MITHNIRERMDRDYVRKRYTQALSEYNENIQKKNYVVSFLLITALLEERINVCWLLLDWYERDSNMSLVSKPVQKDIIEMSMFRKVSYLKSNEWINEDDFVELKSLLRERNFLIHLSLYNMKEYTQEICDRFYKMFRVIDKASRDIKSMIDEGK